MMRGVYMKVIKRANGKVDYVHDSAGEFVFVEIFMLILKGIGSLLVFIFALLFGKKSE